MNISRENVDDLNAVLTINVEKEDYAERVEKELRGLKKQVQMKGFRPGMVPMGVVKKMYGTKVLADELNKIISESLTKHITEENLHVLGEPLPNESQEPLDIENNENFEFKFDLGVAPVIEYNLTKRDKVTYYEIEITDEDRDKQIKHYQSKFGSVVQVDKVADKSMLKGDFAELDEEGNIKEGGILAEDVMISVEKIADEDIKNKIIDVEKNSTVTFNVRKAYPNDTEIASMLKIEKDEASNLNSDFIFTIKEITDFKESEVNQELFDKVYGKGEVKSEEEFNEKIREELKGLFVKDSDYKLILDIKDKFLKKLDISLPDNFLKRWLKATDKKLTDEVIEKEYDRFAKDFQWTLFRDKVAKDNNITVEQKDMLEEARNLTKMQFAYYGISDLPEVQLMQYTENLLKNKDEVRKIGEKILDEKVVAHIKENIKIENKLIKREELSELISKQI